MAPPREITHEMMPVLVADDDPATRLLLRTALTNWDYIVQEAENGEEAWAIISQPNAPKLLILDCIMPNPTGYELCARIRQQLEPDYIPYIILLTQNGGEENIIKGLDAGANEFLTKPFHTAELRSRIAVGRKIISYESALVAQNQQLKNYIAQMEAANLLVVNASQSLGTAMKDAASNEAPLNDASAQEQVKIAHSALDEIMDVFKNFNPEKPPKRSKSE
jgi:CheY-like chemotaxis protein